MARRRRRPTGQIPFEIQVEILKRLPVKSLIQFRSVSKAWLSLIDSSAFIAANSLLHTPLPHLVLRYENPSDEYTYVSFTDDDTLAQQKLTVPIFVELLRRSNIKCCSHGLLCVYGEYDFIIGIHMKVAVLWNPSIRKYILINVPYFSNGGIRYLGFGVCPVTIEPKIVLITDLHKWLDKWSHDVEPNWDIRVYTLKSRIWRKLPSNLLRASISALDCQVATNRFIYWLACDKFNRYDDYRRMIISFDITDEIFSMVDLPDSIPQIRLSISKLRESLAVLQYSHDCLSTYNVWIMEDGDGDQKAFIKLFTIETPHASIYPLAFRKNGDVLIDTTDEDYDEEGNSGCRSAIVCYEPKSKRITDLGICTSFLCTSVESYTESLLLLGQSGCRSY